MRRWIGLRTWVTAVAVVALFSSASASDVEKKWRFGFGLHGYDARDDVESEAANVLGLTDAEDREILRLFIDPRDDGAAINTLSIEPAVRADVTAQYAFTKIFVLEMSAGYQKSDVGDVEMQAEFFGSVSDPLDPDQRFQFVPFLFNAGELTQVPIKATALARFRPRYGFNPYIGAGVGYTIIGFEPSEAMNTISRRLDASQGCQARVPIADATPVIRCDLPPDFAELQDLSGATVDARDTFEWHLVGGAEIDIKKNWQLFFDLQWAFASRTLRIQFNGVDNFGLPVPQGRRFETEFDEISEQRFGPVQISEGGLVDGGSIIREPIPGEQQTINCGTPDNPDPNTLDRCRNRFDPTAPDGELDPGFYYVQGGEIRYDNVTFGVGFRYTF